MNPNSWACSRRYLYDAVVSKSLIVAVSEDTTSTDSPSCASLYPGRST